MTMIMKAAALVALATSLAACGGPQERDLTSADRSYQNQLMPGPAM